MSVFGEIWWNALKWHTMQRAATVKSLLLFEVEPLRSLFFGKCIYMTSYICAAIASLDSLLERIHKKKSRIARRLLSKSVLNGTFIYSRFDKATITSIRIHTLTAAIQLSACKFQSVRVESIHIRQFRSASREEKFWTWNFRFDPNLDIRKSL